MSGQETSGTSFVDPAWTRALLEASCRMIDAGDHAALWAQVEHVLVDLAGRDAFWVVAYPLAGPVFFASEGARREGDAAPTRAQLDAILSTTDLALLEDGGISVKLDGGRVLECLHFANVRGGVAMIPPATPFEADDVFRVLRVMLPAAIDALSRRQLAAEAAIRDPLTGLLNGRELERRFREEAARCARHGQPLSVLLGDIDHFKRINATHGHVQGDLVLREVAERLVGGLRLPDVVARLGAEDFVVLLPECPLDRAIEVAERLRAAIARAPFRLPSAGGEVFATMSFGVTALDGSAGIRWDAVAAKLEKALARAKWEGRNKVMPVRG